MKRARVDLRVENHGSIFLFRPMSDAGETWLRESVDAEALWFAGALACEPRYARGLADGASAEGLVVR